MLELGAAWAQDKSFPMLAPPLTLKDVANGPLASLQLTLVSADGLDQLRDEIGDLLRRRMPVTGWAARRDEAIRDIIAALDKPGPVPITGLAAIGVRDHHVEVISRDAEGRVAHAWWPPDDGEPFWSKPRRFSVPGDIVDLAAASRGSGHAVIFALDRRGVLWHSWWESPNWSGWKEFDSRHVAPYRRMQPQGRPSRSIRARRHD